MSLRLKNISLSKYLAVCALGFGLAGLIWGWLLYEDRAFDSPSPFHYAAIPIVGALGGLALSILSKNWRVILKSIIVGILGQGVGTLVGVYFTYPLTLAGIFLLGFLPIPVDSIHLFELKPYLGITGYWLIFFVIGLIAGLSFALALRRRILPVIWRSSVGFALGSLVGPIIGNTFGGMFGSLLISYLATFIVVCISFGLFLGYGIYGFGKYE